MTEPLKPISKAAQVTNQSEGGGLAWKLESQSVYLKDQTSPLVAPDTFVSGEEVLAASLALFAPEPSQKERKEISAAQKTLESDRLDYLLGLSHSRIAAKSESNSAELHKKQEEFSSLYAAHAAELARLEKQKKKKGWKRISEFLKSVFLKD